MSNDKTGEIPVRRKTKVSVFDANQNRVSRGLRGSREANLMGNRLIFRYLHTLKGDGVEEVLRTDELYVEPSGIVQQSYGCADNVLNLLPRKADVLQPVP